MTTAKKPPIPVRPATAGPAGRSAPRAGVKRAVEGSRPDEPPGAAPQPLFTLDVGPLVDAVQRHVALRPKVVLELREDLRRTLERLARGSTPSTEGGVVPDGDRVLGTQEAADLVGVSRPFMAARIDAGDIPLFQQVGNQRRVLASSVLAWHERSRERRRQALAELGRQMEDEYRPEA